MLQRISKHFYVNLDHGSTKKVELNHQNFTFGVELGAIDKEKKTVSFVLSNEDILNRGWYDLKLLHGKKNVSLDRKDILKVFFNHKTWNDLPLGKWQNLKIENNSLKADAVFDAEDEKAMEIFGKIERGFLESVSVGIDVLQHTREQRPNEKDLIIATEWEIYECSIVSIPANPQAKVGLEREENDFDPTKPEKNKKTEENEPMTLEELQKKYPELYKEVLEKGAKNENGRVSAILTAVGATALASEPIKEKLFDQKSTVIDIQAALYTADVEKREKMAKQIKEDGENLQKSTEEVGGGADGSQSPKETIHEKMMKRKKAKKGTK